MAAKDRKAIFNLIQPYQESMSGRYGDITKDAIYKNCWFLRDANGEIYLEKRPSINTSVVSAQGHAFGMVSTSGISHTMKLSTAYTSVYGAFDYRTITSVSGTSLPRYMYIASMNVSGTGYYPCRTSDFITWTQTALSPGAGLYAYGSCYALAFVTPKVIGVGNSGGLYTSDLTTTDVVDGDAAWTTRTNPGTGATTYFAVNNDRTNAITRVIAVGYHTPSITNCFAAYTDDGVTWNAGTMPSSPYIYYGVRCLYTNTAATSVWIAFGSGGIIHKTSDGGANWTAKTSGVSSTLVAASNINDYIVVVGTNVVVYSDDAGETWSTISTASYSWTDVYYYSGYFYCISSNPNAVAILSYTGTGWSINTYVSFGSTGTTRLIPGEFINLRGSFLAINKYATLFPAVTTADTQSKDFVQTLYVGTSLLGSYSLYQTNSVKDYIYLAKEQNLYKYTYDLGTQLCTVDIGGSYPLGGKIAVATLRQANGTVVDCITVPGNTRQGVGSIYLSYPGSSSFTSIITPGDTSGNYFPANEGDALARGVVALDGYFFFLTKSGKIYNTSLGYPEQVITTNVLVASRYNDLKTYITKHSNHIVVFGTKGIEFFNNVGNPLGSPLARRDDIYFPIGCSAGNSADTIRSVTIFVGSDGDSNVLGVYTLEGTKLSRVSTPVIEQHISIAVTQEWNSIVLNDALVGTLIEKDGHVIYVLTIIDSSSNAKSFVYDLDSRNWYQWYIQDRSGALDTSGGKLGTEWFTTTSDVLDIVGACATVESYPYIQLSTGEVYKWPKNTYTSDLGSTAIEMIVQTNNYDYGTIQRKFFNAVYFRCDKVGSTNNISIQYSDDDGATWSTARTVDLNSYYPVATRWGQARRRQWRFTHTATTAVRLQAIELEVEGVGNEFQPKRRTSAAE